MLNILFLTAAILLFISPLLIENLSFLLSFLATFGILVLEPVLKHKINFSFYGLESDLFSTIAAQVFVWPVISLVFGKISIISVFANFLVLWVVPICTVLGIIYLPLFFIFSFLNLSFLLEILGFPLKVLLIYFVQVVNLLSKIPFGSVAVQMDRTALVLYYIVVLGVVLLIRKNAKEGSGL